MGAGRKEIDNKLRLAEKTKILNLSDGGLKSSSSVWERVGPLCPGLRSLDVSGSRLGDGVPPCLFRLSSVKILNLSSCSLSGVPDLSALVCLVNLKLNHNALTSNSIASMPSSVTQLDLSFNRLDVFPPGLLGLSGVKELNLNDNQLVDLSGVETLTALISINCDNNHITQLHDNISSLKVIMNVSLANNR
jgi:Leucine-rich repeat (LRR) protein